jgi:predicted transposase/invertase (TIGR01784 family)
MNEDKSHYLTKVKLCDVESKEVFYNKLTYYYLEMPKFTKKESELSNHLEYWLYMLNNISSLEELPKKFEEDKLLNRAFDISEFLALDKDRQFAYQQDLKTRLDYKNVMDYAKEEGLKEGLKEGIKKGIEEGIEQGINKGLKQGIDRGREEGIKQEKIEIAKNLLDILDVDTIALKTGLTIDEINTLISD